VPKRFDSPEQTRPFEDIKGKLDLINVEAVPSAAASSPVGGAPSPSSRAPDGQLPSSPHGLLHLRPMTIVMNGGEEMEFGPVT
jgi:hypothetical protein